MSAKVVVDQEKFKLTYIIPKDLIKRVKRATIDYDTNIISIVIESLEDYLKIHPEKK